MRTPLFSLFAIVLASTGLVAAGDRPDAKLVYVRKPGATICPDEPLMRQLVAARLGYDAFRDESDRRIVVTISRESKGFRAVLELHDAGGTSVGTRTLTSGASDCNELASSIALALTIAIDPLAGAAPSASAPASIPPAASSAPPPERPASVVVAAPSTAAIAPPPPRGLFPFAGLGSVAALAAAPELTFGLTAAFGVRGAWYSIALEGRVDAETGKRVPEGEVRSSILAGALVPCLHQDVLMVCGIASYGALRGTGVRAVSSPWAALGARIGLEATVYGPIALRGHVDALALVERTRLDLADVKGVWTTPPISILLGLGVVAHFR